MKKLQTPTSEFQTSSKPQVPICEALLNRMFHTRTEPLINTGALARWRDAITGGELFQQFAGIRRKPLKPRKLSGLKRLRSRGMRLHRAKAPVLTKIGLNGCDLSGPRPIWSLDLDVSLELGAWRFVFRIPSRL